MPHKQQLEQDILRKQRIQFGAENLRKPELKQYIDKRMTEKEDKLIAKQDEILKYLTLVLRGESSSEEIVIEGIGDGYSEAKTMQKAPSEKERLKAAELLGKRYSLFADKIEHSGKIENSLPLLESINRQLGGGNNGTK